MRAVSRLSLLLLFATAVAAFGEEWTIGTLGGRSAPGARDGHGRDAAFNVPFAIATDNAGNLYVADRSNHVVRKVTPSGDVTTLAGMAGQRGWVDARGAAARFSYPNGVAVDSTGNVYVSEAAVSSSDNPSLGSCTIRKITPVGVVTTVAGAKGDCRVLDGPSASARFAAPSGLSIDGQGNLLVADSDAIRKLTPGGQVTTVAASVGPAIQTAIDSSGNIFFVESIYSSANSTCSSRIGKVATNGTVTILGKSDYSSFADGPLASAGFGETSGIAVDPSGTLFIADAWNHVIRKITSDQMVTTFAGGGVTANGKTPLFGGVDGTGVDARFYAPWALAIDTMGNLFVADTGSNTIRKITPSAVVTTVAGWGVVPVSADGPVATAHFNNPVSIASDNRGNTYVFEESDDGNDPKLWTRAIRRINSGVVTTLTAPHNWGIPTDGSLSTAKFDHFGPAVADASGNIYFADRYSVVRRMTTAGNVETVSGAPSAFRETADGPVATAKFGSITGLTFDPSGNLWVTDGCLVRKISGGMVTTVAGLLDQCSRVDGVGTAARFSGPNGIVADSAGNLYVADRRFLRKMTPSGVVTTIAGTDNWMLSVQDGTGSTAVFSGIQKIAIASSGLLAVCDGISPSTLRTVTPQGVLTTVAGTLSSQLTGTDRGSGYVDGSGSKVRFGAESSGFPLTFDSSGMLLISDTDNNVIRTGQPAVADIATVDHNPVSLNTVAQLGTNPQTATSWKWSFVRKPSAGIAQLSSTTLRNPTFAPDAVDLYTLELTASSAAGVRVSTVDVTATNVCTPLSAVSASVSGATTFCDRGVGGTASATATNGGAVAYQWGWRATATGSITNIAGATSASYTIRGTDIGRTGVVYLVCTITPECGSTMTTANAALTLDPSVCSTMHGDINGDTTLTSADVMYLIRNLFASGPAPIGPADVNGDGKVNVSDVFYLVNHLFAGGPAPK